MKRDRLIIVRADSNHTVTGVCRMHVQEAIATRLSIRRYADNDVSPEHMQTLFKALQLAPSANNRQNWEFVFIGDPQLKKELISEYTF